MPAARLASRALHINVNPTPMSMHDSRAILRELQKHGEVVSFRNLAFEPAERTPNTILVVFREQVAVQKLLEKQVMKLKVWPQNASDFIPASMGLNLSDMFKHTKVPEPQSKAAMTERQLQYADGVKARGQFTEYNLLFETSYRDYATRVQRHPFYWGFSKDSKDFSEEALSRTVPFEGLSTVNNKAKEVPLRVIHRMRKKIEERKTLHERKAEVSDWDT